MSARRLPVTIGRDASPSPTWEAVWSDESASAYERGEAVRLGEPIGYWSPSVGWLGQWMWPDGTHSNVEAHPLVVEREAGGALYRLSRDGGVTWSTALMTRDELQAASGGLAATGSGSDGGGESAKVTPAPAPISAPSTRPRGGISYADGIMLVLLAAAAWDIFVKRPKR